MRSVVGPPPHQNANERKRPSSSSLLAQDMQVSHKMRCDSQNIPSLDELAHPLGSKPESISDKRDTSVSEPMQKVKMESTVMVTYLPAKLIHVQFFDASGLIYSQIPSNQSAEISMGLRKCTKAPESSTHLTECHTPGSVVKSRPVGTPKSGSGSIMFSPGDSFWNEAILFADGLSMPTENSGSVEAKDGGQNSEKADNCSENLKKSLGLDKSRVNDKDAIGYSKVGEKHGRDFNREASPLPVKNLELLFQDKKTNGGTRKQCASLDQNNITRGNSTVSESVLVENKGLGTLDIASNAQANKHLIGRKYPEPEGKQVLVCHDNHSVRSVSMTSNVRKPADSSESEESYTPSSSHHNKDGLSLSTWLPSEVCSVYNKKGISKLYPWQVHNCSLMRMSLFVN